MRKRVQQTGAVKDSIPLSPLPLSRGARGVEDEEMKMNLRTGRCVVKVF